MPSEPADDEFDRQLRALTGGAAGEAGFFEPSAAERARNSVRPARRPARRTARRWSASRVAQLFRRYRSALVVILILAALVATAIGLSWLSSH